MICGDKAGETLMKMRFQTTVMRRHPQASMYAAETEQFIDDVWQTSIIAFFFFQAEDGIRVSKVTGVQTCALPICITAPCCCAAARWDRPFTNRSCRPTMS